VASTDRGASQQSPVSFPVSREFSGEWEFCLILLLKFALHLSKLHIRMGEPARLGFGALVLGSLADRLHRTGRSAR
jgi:hypothetical protein